MTKDQASEIEAAQGMLEVALLNQFRANNDVLDARRRLKHAMDLATDKETTGR
jgi:hypothetical protein